MQVRSIPSSNSDIWMDPRFTLRRAFLLSKGGTLYVVTAGHVARDSFSYTAIVRYLASRSDGTLTSIDARLTMPHENWVLHPQEGDATHSPVDVAAMKITNHGGIRVFWYCPSDCPDQKGILFAKEDAEPPMPVLVFGFPLNEPGLRLLRSVPLGRQGIIGLVDTTEDEIQVDGKYFDRLGFIIDIPTLIGGSSGSPVLSNAPLSRQSLVGLISGATDRGDPGAYARAGGYAVAEPVSRIEEVLNSPRIEKMPAVDTWCLLSAPDCQEVQAITTIPSLPIVFAAIRGVVERFRPGKRRQRTWSAQAVRLDEKSPMLKRPTETPTKNARLALSIEPFEGMPRRTFAQWDLNCSSLQIRHMRVTQLSLKPDHSRADATAHRVEDSTREASVAAAEGKATSFKRRSGKFGMPFK